MRILGILPFLFLWGVAVLLRRTHSARDSLTLAAVITGVWIVAGCELLSLFHAVAFWPLLFWWSVPMGVLGWKCRGWRPATPAFSKDWLLLTLIVLTVLVLGLIFVQAWFTPPNNWDALSYHLPRIVYWKQQQHIGLFPTDDARMLVMPPFAEYTGLHLMILSGGDKWLNLIQWLALALTAISASSIALELGCKPRSQALAALLVVTIPIAALEAANPKNDVVTAFFLSASVWLGLKASNSSRTASALLVGATFGLLIFSKGTGMILGLPVAVWIAATHIRAVGFKRALVWGASVAVTVFAINAPLWIRLTTAFDSPFGPPRGKGGTALANKAHGPRAVVSNILRNTAMHIATGSTNVDLRLTEAVAAFHNAMGMDVNDRATTFIGSRPFRVSLDLRDEDRAKAPVHVLLGIGVSVVALGRLFRLQDKSKSILLLLPLMALVIFSFVLAWQEWHSRLHIPLLCLTAALAPCALPRASLICAFAAFVIGLSAVIGNQAKPLLHLKQARYRYRDEDVVLGVNEAVRAVHEQRPRAVGIYSRLHRCEYFLLSALLKRETPPPLFAKVNNMFPQIRSTCPEPELVIGWHRQPPQTNTLFYDKYSLSSKQGAVAIFRPVNKL